MQLLFQFKVPSSTNTKSATIQFDQINTQPIGVGCIEPDQHVLLQHLPGSGQAGISSQVAGSGVEWREDSREEPGDITDRRIPVSGLLDPLEVSNGQQMSAWQILINHLRQVMGGQ